MKIDPPTTETQELFEPLDFVYCGKRLLSTGKLGIAICPIKDGVLQAKSLYPFTRKSERLIGGVYTGTTFSETRVRGLESAKYSHCWKIAIDLIDWQARDELAASEVRTKKLEVDAKQISVIEQVMLPLRQRYATYRKQRDHAGMEALQAAVLRALRSSPRSTEL